MKYLLVIFSIIAYTYVSTKDFEDHYGIYQQSGSQTLEEVQQEPSVQRQEKRLQKKTQA